MIFISCVVCGNELESPYDLDKLESLRSQYPTVRIKDVCDGCLGKINSYLDDRNAISRDLDLVVRTWVEEVLTVGR